MKKVTFISISVLITILLSPSLLPADTTDDKSTGLDEAHVVDYLKKKAPGDTGSCLVDAMKIDIIGISDVVPGHQAEVFYNFDYSLRCNRGTKTKSGQGILRAGRLRDGNWIDRETFTLINKK